MSYKVKKTSFDEVLLLEPEVYSDDRGYFFESFNQKDFNHSVGLEINFVQDNHSKSKKNVLRGLHYQVKKPQGKLIRVLRGKIFDVVVDMRLSSPNYGKWFGVIISSENRLQLWVPEGFAHGFLTLSDAAELAYKTSDYWHPKYERSLLWNDDEIGIEWPISDEPLLTEKDSNGSTLKEAEPYD
tara:strand:+ start:23 stop:574 length:552 start_codon:yes stop_codon:yes gene_type:complete